MIVIYGNSICPACSKAKELADSYRLEWEFRNVSKQEYLEEYLRLFPGENRVPQITWHGKPVGGYTEFASEIENTRNYGDGQI